MSKTVSFNRSDTPPKILAASVWYYNTFKPIGASGAIFCTTMKYYGRRVPANTCHASADLATRLSSIYTFSP